MFTGFKRNNIQNKSRTCDIVVKAKDRCLTEIEKQFKLWVSWKYKRTVYFRAVIVVAEGFPTVIVYYHVND